MVGGCLLLFCIFASLKYDLCFLVGSWYGVLLLTLNGMNIMVNINSLLIYEREMSRVSDTLFTG